MCGNDTKKKEPRQPGLILCINTGERMDHMPQVKMFITDFDGTLFRSDKSISQNDLDILEELGAKGVVRVLATGRSLFSLQRSVPLPLPVDYLIYSTGLGVARYPDPHEHTLKTESLTVDDTQSIGTLLDEFNLDYMIHAPVPDNHRFSYRYSGKGNPDFFTRIGFYEGHAHAISSHTEGLGPSSQFLVMVPEPKSQSTLELIRIELGAAYTVIKTTSPFDGKTVWIEIFPKTVSKSKAAEWLAGTLNISREHIVAVGNDYNDEDLLEWAGQGFIVDNGPDDMKERFTVVPSNNAEGVRAAAVRGTSGSRQK